jgi:hypothetical protein
MVYCDRLTKEAIWTGDRWQRACYEHQSALAAEVREAGVEPS